MSQPNRPIESQYREVEARMNATVVEQAQRMIENPGLYFAPDKLQRHLFWEIAELRRQFVDLEKLYLSERGLYLFVSCIAGEHKKCPQQSKILRCGCGCHRATT
ncbi:MAG TPA: hypothetical protein VJ302_23290 [Blastocatellia bacterium]|nr:hypothetical protein [Blastocatellia bacterium]